MTALIRPRPASALRGRLRDWLARLRRPAPAAPTGSADLARRHHRDLGLASDGFAVDLSSAKADHHWRLR